MTEQPPRTGPVLLFTHWRVIVEPQTEIGVGQLGVEQVRVAAQALKHCLRDRPEQLLMPEDEWAELQFIFRARPVIFRPKHGVALRNIECAAAENPSLDEVGMNLTG